MTPTSSCIPDAGLAITDYEPSNGDHLCSVWTDPAADRRTGREFLRRARSDELALAVLDRSRDENPATAALASVLATDPVELFSTDEVHVSGGYFDPERMRRFWAQQSTRIRAAGLRHLRAVAEMAWEMRGLPGSEHAPVFESSLNPLFSSLPASVLCQYGSAGFDRETVLAMVLSHPMVVIGDTVFSNPFHVGDEQFAERFEELRRDAGQALLPIWSHFVLRQRTAGAVGSFLCNSLPTLTGADRIVVALRGLPPLSLSRDRVESADAGSQFTRGLRTAAKRSRPVANGRWGTVRATTAHEFDVRVASLTDAGHVITVMKRGEFPEPDAMRFVLAAWDTGSILQGLDPASDVGM